ncbi:alpha-2-macroglobulin family protein [Epibacterium sp. SM1979]|uniref:Alpha-2-macroglobulin family protein n=1 Tax=Tritonibacter litoralis TaxID=2662264 RepID=A0A843YH30_9RHOB|nr:alpha-2-macroglobulin family protein [Tritonibacter litoralis]MQQ08553.1 alpha-2-macroglobulin family protein [Tritonibacter litoralis]
MRRWIVAGFLALNLPLSAPFAAAQEVVPAFRFQGFENTDFYGADLQPLFDSDLKSCIRLCEGDANCTGFVFNRNSNACFPKAEMETPSVYDGAFSALKRPISDALRAQGQARAQVLSFLSEQDLTRAGALARDLGLDVAWPDQPVEVLVQQARRLWRADQPNQAAQIMAQAVLASDRADLWSEYARYLRKDTSGSGDVLQARQARTLSAAVNGFLRAPETGGQASALMQVALALEALNRGRDMIPTLRLAQDLEPRQAAADLLDTAIGKYGFRVTGSDVQTDTAQPEICVTFSEKLHGEAQDYEAFVRLPSPDLVVRSRGQQLCIDGVEFGVRYAFTLRRGLPAASGELLHKDVTLTHYVRDRAPSVRFPGRAYVLARTGDAALPIETVNLDAVDLRLRRVSDRNLLRAMQEDFFARPLSYWQEQSFDGDIAQEVWRGTAEVDQSLNKDVTNRLPLDTALQDQPVGIYALSAAIPGADPYDNPAATQWFVLTDLGLSTVSGSDGLHVQVLGLGDARPRDGIDVTLISAANGVLGRASTDATGYARFEPGLTRGQGGGAPALVLARQGADDFAFLSLQDAAFDLSDRGVEGRAPAGPIDAFLATDRGAYRAGESIQTTVLLRNDKAQALEGVPVTAVLTRPDGVEYSRHISDAGQLGGHHFTLPIAASAPRGTWRLTVHVDPNAPPLASKSVLVEDFQPERIDFTQTLAAETLTFGQPTALSVDARYLFGAPGADLTVQSDMILRSSAQLPDWPGYHFGRHDQPDETRRITLSAPNTDAAGQTRLPVTLPELRSTGRPISAEILTRVSDGAARPVERSLTVPVRSDTPMIGIKRGFDDVVAQGTEARFDVIAVTGDQRPTPMPVRWRLNRIETRYQWYQLYGNWNWEATERRHRVASGQSLLADKPLTLDLPVDWGEYELEIERDGGAYLSASYRFYAGWYVDDDNGATPDRLDMSLDRPDYAPGDTAQLRIVSATGGTALVSVLSNRLIERHAVDVQPGETLVPLTVSDAWGSGAYVMAQVLQPLQDKPEHAPTRALGIAHASVVQPGQTLAVTIDAPDLLRPGGPREIRLQVAGAEPGEEVFVSVAAVDQGILNLTGFETPDPSAHYYGQRRLGVELRDLYGRLIDPGNGALGRIRSGGDAGNGMNMKSPPPTQELMARSSGVLQVGPDGTVRFPFDIPAFNGEIRVMAMAWSASALGQAEAEIPVRDPIVVAASLPQFLAPGDQSRVLLDITQVEDGEGPVALSVTTGGEGLSIGPVPQTLDLEQGRKLSLQIPVAAGTQTGDNQITVTLTTADGRTLEQDLALAVVANDPEVATTQRIQLAAGSPFRFSDDVFANLKPGSGRALLSAGPVARFDVPGLLTQLDRYPYGCTEQVTSRALPLLYLSSVAEQSGLGSQPDLDLRVAEAIDTILSRQTRSGGFGLWRASGTEQWLDAYVTDFLARARDQGHAVPQRAFDQALDNLQNRVNYAPDFDQGGEAIAYALLVLAREGAAALGDLRYYADVKAEAFATPMAVAQLGAALATYGDQTRADALFAQAGQMLATQNNETPMWRADFGTYRRDTAAVLTLAAEVGSNAVDHDALSRRVAQGGDHSTQEAVWQLLAAQALLERPEQSGLRINGVAVTGPFVELREAGGAEQIVTAAEGQLVDLTLTTFGVPLTPPEARGYGYRIERNHYGMDGTPLLLSELEVGTRFVTVVRVVPANSQGARLMINDPLPAGVEIDNPNLLRSGDLRDFDWLNISDVEQAEFRSDRFLAAVDSNGGGAITLAYVARAVSPGVFHLPAATVEDMYRPIYRANTAAGQVSIR